MELKEKLIEYQATLQPKSQADIEAAELVLAEYSKDQLQKINTATFFLLTLSAIYQLSIKRIETSFQEQDIIDEAFKMRSHTFGYQTFRPIIEDSLKNCIKSKTVILTDKKYQLADYCVETVQEYLKWVLGLDKNHINVQEQIRQTAYFMAKLIK